jgi:hypothetical protein
MSERDPIYAIPGALVTQAPRAFALPEARG